jgi:hypothetical protein
MDIAIGADNERAEQARRHPSLLSMQRTLAIESSSHPYRANLYRQKGEDNTRNFIYFLFILMCSHPWPGDTFSPIDM